nr:primase-helicase family protein [Pseudomonas luteola]
MNSNNVVNIKDARDPALDYLRDRFVAIPNIKSRNVLIVDTLTFGEQMDLDILVREYRRVGGLSEAKTKKITEDYLASCLYYCIEKVFVPNAPRVLHCGHGVHKLNLWDEHLVEFSGVKVSKDDVPLYIEYMERMFPVVEERRYMHWWLAHAVRRPDRKIIATPVLRSTQGIGKSFLTQTLLASIMGKNAAIGDLGHITGQFQDTVVGKTLIALDEVYCDKKRTVDALKVFQSNEKIIINQKHKAAYSIDNYINFMINSNDYDPVVFESHDRRFFIPQFIDHKVDQVETQQFIERMAHWIEQEGGAQLIRDFMETINLDSYNPKAPAPMTVSKQARVGYNFEDRLIEAVQELIKDVKVVKSVDVHCRLVNSDDEFKEVKIRRVAATLEQCGCIPKKTNSCTYQITPFGLASGLTTNSTPKTLEENLADIGAF